MGTHKFLDLEDQDNKVTAAVVIPTRSQTQPEEGALLL